MSALRETEWIAQYKMAKRAVQQKRAEGVAIPQGESKDMTSKVEFLSRNLQVMASSPMEYEIAASELARRQLILENLRKQVLMIPVEGRKIFNNNNIDTSGGNRTPVNNNNSSNSNKLNFEIQNPMTGSFDGSGGNSNYSDQTNKGLILRQKETLRQQDEMIEDISKGVDRLHNQALEIGNETKIQIQIIDQFDKNTDQAVTDIQNQNKNIQGVQAATNTCAYYVCITLEVIAIIALLIIVFGLAGTKK